MIDWRELELDEITEWPLLPQGLIALVLTVLLSIFGYWYWLRSEERRVGKECRL